MTRDTTVTNKNNLLDLAQTEREAAQAQYDAAEAAYNREKSWNNRRVMMNCLKKLVRVTLDEQQARRILIEHEIEKGRVRL